VVISGYDISDRKEIEAALLATEEKYRSLVLNVPGAVFRCDSIYTLAYVSDAIEDITGYPASDLVNNQVQSYLGMIHPDDIDRIKDSLVQTVLDQHRSSIEYRIIHADGQIRWVSEHKQGVFAPDGSLLWLDGILLDISDRKRAEVTLGRYEAQNRSMTQLLPDWIRFNGLDPIPNYILNPNTPIPD
jgi:PAS domain S-box-containing protein